VLVGTDPCSCCECRVLLISDSMFLPGSVAGWNTKPCEWPEDMLDTLLGPEKTPCLVWVVSPAGPLLAGVPNAFVGGRGGSWWVGVWLCVECCIVDASILLWCKCLRAHGGCLGIRSR
jgi:hypothetical protein